MRRRPAKGNATPSRTREALAVRDNQQCQRCGLRAAELHHRRSRRVRDAHTHCCCNTVLLCGPGGCHAWAHGQPEQARETGLIVGRDVTEPWAVPVFTFQGWAYFECDGTVRLT